MKIPPLRPIPRIESDSLNAMDSRLFALKDGLVTFTKAFLRACESWEFFLLWMDLR